MMKLTVAIPTYNRLEQLKRQITFFIDEKILYFKDIEFIISDNASTDGTLNYLEIIKKDYPKIIINFNKTNIGATCNMIKLIQMSCGEYIWLVGDDDEIRHGTLNKIRNILYKNVDLTWLFIRFESLVQDNKIESYELQCKEYYSNGIDLFAHIASSGYKLGGLMFLSASVHKTKYVKEAIEIYLRSKEVKNANKALPLGLSYYSALCGPAKITDEVGIIDNVIDIGWSNYIKKVFCRDQIAMLDLMSKKKNVKLLKQLDLKSGLDIKNPEWIYMKSGFKENNYAMWFYLRNRPMQILYDLFDAIREKILRKIGGSK